MAHKIHFPAEFSSNLNQTHLSMLISVFRIIRKSQVGEFDQQPYHPAAQDRFPTEAKQG